MKLLYSRHRGFSLIEVLIAAALMLIVSAGATWAFISAAKIQRDTFNNALVDAESRKIESWLVSDLRGAITVEPSYAYNGVTYTSGNDTLILRMPSVDTNGVPIKIGTTPSATTSDFIVYYHDQDSQMHRLLVRNAASWRDKRNTGSEDKKMADSRTKGIVYQSTFAVAPGALGPVVVHYQFKSTRKSYNGRGDYQVASSGSVFLRNRPTDPT